MLLHYWGSQGNCRPLHRPEGLNWASQSNFPFCLKQTEVKQMHVSSRSHVRNTKWKKKLFYPTVWLLRVTWLFEPKNASIRSLLYFFLYTFRHRRGLRAFCQVDITLACRLSCVLWMLSSKAGAVCFKMRWRGW